MNFEKLSDSKREKLKIAQRFDRAAQTYAQAARLQQQVGHHLLTLLEEKHSLAKTMVDLGAGDGLLAGPLAMKFLNDQGDRHLMHLDLAWCMLQQGQHQAHHRSVSHVCADFDMLPYANHSINFIFSNMALQWSLNLPQTFLELYRVLSSQGTLVCSMPICGSLTELHQSIRAIDPHRMVNYFIDAAAIKGSLAKAGFKLVDCETQKIVLFYRDVDAIIRQLHDSGTNTVKFKKSTSLAGRNFITQLTGAYQKFSNPQGQLPMTFNIYYFKAVKAD